MSLPVSMSSAVVVASARIGQEPVIAYAEVTDAEFTIHLIRHCGPGCGPVSSASVQWIAASVTDGIGILASSEEQALQTAEYAEYNNAQLVYFPLLFDSTPVVVNNAHASDNEPYIASPWNIGTLRFQPQFIDHSGAPEPTAWLQTVAVGGGVTDPELGNNFVIQANRATYSDGAFIHFSLPFLEAPTVIANAWDGVANPVIASAWGNGTTGFFISLRDHDGNPVSNVEVQWIAIGLVVHHIEISPGTATITAGDTQAYTAEAFDPDNNSLGDVTDYTTFEIEPGAGGSWTANVYTSKNPGTWIVTGTSAGKSDTATLTVESE